MQPLWGSHDDREEVFTVITFVSPNQSRQATFGMPISRCDHGLTLRALPVFKGQVSVLGTDARVRIATTDVYGVAPGIPAWSPPI